MIRMAQDCKVGDCFELGRDVVEIYKIEKRSKKPKTNITLYLSIVGYQAHPHLALIVPKTYCIDAIDPNRPKSRGLIHYSRLYPQN